MTVEKIESGKRYERGMRYKLSFCNGDYVQYLTEMAFLELGREIIQLQNTSSNSDYAKRKIEAEIKRLEENPEGDYVTRISALEWVLRIIAKINITTAST